jgi:hypothetical protein
MLGYIIVQPSLKVSSMACIDGSITILYYIIKSINHSMNQPIKAKQGRAKQSRAKQSKAEQSKAEQSKAKQSKAKQSRAKQSSRGKLVLLLLLLYH